MANTLTNVIPQLLAQGLMALREMAIMPLLVNRQYDEMAGQQGSSIDVPLPSTVAVQDVTPSNTPPSTTDQTPGTVAIALSRWKEAPFYLTDKDMLEASRGTIPMMASEAIRALANEVDQYILGLGTQFYGAYGVPGTAPFPSAVVTDAPQIRKVLNNQLAPLDNRRLVMNPDAEAAALAVRAFHDASFGVGGDAILKGQIKERLGFGWFMDQNVQTHTAGTATAMLVNDASTAIGEETLAVDGDAGTMVVGDIFTIAGDTQTYVVTAGTTGAGTISIQPGLVVAAADDAAITLKATHVMNLAFHRDAIAFATRPLLGSMHPNSIIESAVDPVSGLTLRLEVSREHKRDRFSFDILYGANVVRRELGARLFG